ncbi:PREDICTED: uncharacterized protein LOC108533632 [Rhinopithecus bieti]|uniref:uncharacterized protein LOC108533632 n=1 Tax=Rhinopithecus bieti TaxID=61621 RepID=UPI00083BCA30|nr:PREDICTED: uncharacterized protein LOC108533632 [Rhinopithecus bieti]
MAELAGHLLVAMAMGAPSRDVLLVSAIITVSLSVTVVLCGLCHWCQRKLGKRYKNSLETVGTPDSGRGRSEKKAINDLDRDFWNNNESTVQQKWSSYPPKEFILNISPYAPYGDPRLSLNGTLLSGAKVAAAAGLAVEREGRLGEKPVPVPPPGEDALRSGGAAPSEPGSSGKAGRGRWRTVQSHLAAGKLNLSNFEDSTLSTATTLESIPSSTGEPKCQRPRTLMRQQSLQQPLSQHQRGRQPSQPTTSQSLGQLQAHMASAPGPNSRAYGRGQARQGTSAGSKYRAAGGRSRSNPGSWDHVVGQIRNRGLDMKSFLEGRMVVLSLVLGLSEQDDFANIPDLQNPGTQQNQNAQGDKRLPAGGKAVNTAPVPGQTPHDESDRRTEPRSSVSDLVNSLTSEMLMLSPGSEEDEAHEGCSRENLGRIQFSVGYNFQESTLTVKIMKAQELPAKDFSGTSDPFVKIYLLPDKKHKLETKVKRKNLNPHWNETFLFEGEASATLPPPWSPLAVHHPPTQPHLCSHGQMHMGTHLQAHKCTNTCNQIHLCAHLHACTGTDPHTCAHKRPHRQCLGPVNLMHFVSSWDQVTGAKWSQHHSQRPRREAGPPPGVSVQTQSSS